MVLTFINCPAPVPGRLSAALGGSGTFLPVVLGPPDRWQDAQAACSGAAALGVGRGAAGPRAGALAPSGQVGKLQDQFRYYLARLADTHTHTFVVVEESTC